jgi:CMP-N,N'-diacetyllegionaminic acid synthase
MYKKKKILIVIPARSGSKGIKDKNLKKIGGLSLVEHSINHAKKSKYIDLIAVSTDSRKIQQIALKQKIWCDILRPKQISGDKSQTSLAIIHVLKNIKKKFDYVIELHPTHIFRENNLIDDALSKLILNQKFNSLVSVLKIQSTSHPDFVIKKSKSQKIIFKNSPSVFNRHLLRDYFKSTGVILISKVDSFMKYKRMCNSVCYGYEIKDFLNKSNIDNINDYELAKILWKQYGNKKF